MANSNHDHDDVDPAEERPGHAPRPPQDDSERAPLPEGFLPDDSFLLDVDDETARSPAPLADVGASATPATSGEEWIVVDDDLTAATAAAAESAATVPHAEAASAPPPPAPQTAVPKWFTGSEEGDLPSFASQDAEVASAAAPVGDAPLAPAPVEAPAEAPIESTAPLAPVVPMQRSRRRQIAAAAGLLVALGLGAGWWFFGRTEVTQDEVAVAPRPPRPAPVEPEPVAPVDPEPVVVAPQPVDPEPEPWQPPVEPAPTPVELEQPAPAPVERPVAIDSRPKRPLPPLGERRSAAPPPKGDTIVELRNGHIFRGQITRVKGSRVTLRVGSGECVFDLADVTLLDSTAPEYRRVDQMPEASVVLTSGQHLRGRLMKQTERSVVLVVNNGQVVFPRSDVRNVSFTGRIHF